MTICMTQQTPDFAIRLSDPRLPLVANRAAVAFDKASRGEDTDFAPAKDLAKILRQAFEQKKEEVNPGRARHLDVGTVDLIGRALNASEWDGGVQTVGDVVKKAWKLAEKMEEMPNTGDVPSYSQMRAFCVALGDCLIAYRESLKDDRPLSPYRR